MIEDKKPRIYSFDREKIIKHCCQKNYRHNKNKVEFFMYKFHENIFIKNCKNIKQNNQEK